MLGWFANSQGHAGSPFAPMYAYSQLNTNDHGSPPALVLDLLRNQGIDTTATYAPRHGGAFWSYYDWTDLPNAAERAAAAANRITGWVMLYNTLSSPGATAITRIKQTLAGGRPVALTVANFKRFQQARGSAVISSAGNLGMKLGLHEVLAVGYDRRGVRIENSWGTAWGNGGYGVLDWNYIAKYSYEAETVAGFATTTRANGPTIRSITPASGSHLGGTRVTIAGANLANAIVSVGPKSVVASTVSSDRKQLTFVAPSGSVGAAVVRVSTPVGVSRQESSDVFQYVR